MMKTAGTTMRAVLLTGFGGLEMLEYREEVPIPEPAPNEVLIEVGACGCNNTDIWTREGAYGLELDPNAASGWRREPMEFPRIQGADIVGQIVAVGAHVNPVRVGERVLVNSTLYNYGTQGLLDAGYIGSECDGGFAEYATVPAENAFKITCDMSDVELATFPIAYLTAEHMLNRGRLTQGETIFITGASGGVGSALIQLALLRKAYVIVLTSSGKVDKIRDLGVHKVVTRDVENLPQTVSAVYAGRQVDMVADVVGGALVRDLLTILRPEGRYVSAGAIAGPVIEFDLRTLYLKHLEVIGSTMGTQEEFATLVQYINQKKLRPLVGGVYDLAELRQAQLDFKKKQFFGNLVVVPKR